MPLDPITGGETLATTIIGTVGNILDRLVPDKAAAEKAKLEMQAKVMDAVNNANAQQIEVNKVEAASPSLFVAGWRPFAGWVCGAGFAWAFVVGPIFAMIVRVWAHDYALPVLDTASLTTMLLGLLGLGGMRTWEKIQGIEPPSTPVVTTATKEVRKALPAK